jgi:hypothetical protein
MKLDTLGFVELLNAFCIFLMHVLYVPMCNIYHFIQVLLQMNDIIRKKRKEREQKSESAEKRKSKMQTQKKIKSSLFFKRNENMHKAKYR